MVVELVDRPRDNQWNNLLCDAQPQATLFQSTYWADFLQKTCGDRPLYFASYNKKGTINGVLLAIESCYAKHAILNSSSERSFMRNMLKTAAIPFFKTFLPSILWENGPIVLSNSIGPDCSHNSSTYKELISAVVRKASQDKCYAIKFARPHFFADNVESFSSLGFKQTRMGTILIDLDKTEEDVWTKIDKEARRTVRRGFEQGVHVSKASSIKELEEFYCLNVQSSQRANTKVYPYSRYLSLWNHFSPLDKIAVFIARIKDAPAAAALYLMHNEIMHIFALGDSDYVRENRIRASEVLMWNVLKWAREQGFKFFDHSGVELYKIDAGDKKACGIYRFKAKWGGKLVEYHDYDLRLRQKAVLNCLNPLFTDTTIHN